MTKEQNEACEKLMNEAIEDSPSFINIGCAQWYQIFEEGFQAAQTPERLVLNPLVKGLIEALAWYGENAASINQTKFDPFDCGKRAAEALVPFNEEP